MKNIFYTLPLLIVFILSGCSPARKAARTPTPAAEPSEMPRVILYPKGYEGDVESAASSTTSADIMADVMFSGLECDHVRVKGVNPLPATGRLEVNLEVLKSQFVYPYKGRFLSDFGMRDGRPHTGIDIKTIPDDTIRAVLPGVVRMSKNYSSYGNIVVIRHPQGFETVYAHCSKNLVGVNDRVQAGTPIGLAGRTGRATTEHLHFEVRVAGEPVDPKKMLDIEKENLRGGMFYAEEYEGSLVAYNHHTELAQIKQAKPTSPAPEPIRTEPAPPKNPVAPGLKLTDTENITPVTPAVKETTPANPASTPVTAAQYHTVVKGDTLYAIARKYSTTVKELCRLNNIQETDILSLKQKIRVK